MGVALASARTIGLKFTLTSLSANSCSLQELEQRREAVDRALVEVAADRDPAAAGDPADVLDDAIEGALAAAQRAHPVVRVAVAVERDLDAVQAERQQPIDDLFGVSSSPLVMMLMYIVDAARLRRLPQPLGEVYITGRLSSGSPPKNVSTNFSGRTRSSSRSIQSPTRAGRLERHLVGELVVVAVIALEAVVAGEVALQRRQQRDVQLVGVALDAR